MEQLDVVRRRWRVVLLVLALALVGAGVATAAMPTRYASTVDVVVGQGNGLFQPGVAGGAVQPFTATMASLARSQYVAQQAITRGHMKGVSADGLLNDLSVSFDPQAAVLTLTMHADSAVKAQYRAGLYAHVFSSLVRERFLSTPVKTKGETAAAVAAAAQQAKLAAPSATVWGTPTFNATPVSPRPALNLGVAAIVGLALGLVAAFFRERLDRRPRARDTARADGRRPFAQGRARADTPAP